jgi:ligand-binding sensor domain-containing protein/serine phosphatase RsbU (regulator of sigma subunit)/ABC-type amino acid transport substrate-binding protein
MKNLRSKIIVISLFFLSIFSSAIEGRTLEEIKKSGKLYVGFTRWDYKNINYPLAEEFAKYLDVKMVSVTIDWDESFSQGGKIPADIETNVNLRYTPDAFKKVDIICSTFSELEWRSRLFDFAKTLYSAELLLISRNSEPPKDYSSLKGKTIAYMQGTSFEGHISLINQKINGGIKLRPVKTDDDSKKLLSEGNVYGIILDADEALNFNAENNNQFQIAFPVSEVSNSAWAVEKGNKLKNEVENFFHSIELNGRLDKIFVGHFKLKYSTYLQKIKKNITLQTYHRDLDEIIKSKKLVVAFREKDFIFKEGDQKQFMHALAEEFADHLGIKLEYVITPDINKYFENSLGVIEKEESYSPEWFNYFDIACDLFAPVNWRENKVDFISVYPSEYSLIANKKLSITSYNDLRKFKGVTSKGSVYEEMLKKNGIKNYYYANSDSIIYEITSGKADYAIVFNAFLRLADHPELEAKMNLGEVEVSWAVRKDQPLLRKELEKFMRNSRKDGLLMMLTKALQGKTLQSADEFMNSYYGSFQTGQLPYVLYGTEDGLPQEDIFSIFQDSRGYMWFGTNGGVVRYNGRSMTVFDSQKGMNNNSVLDIGQDTSGIIYFATSRGISECIRDTILKNIFIDKSFSGVLIDGKNNKWFYGDNGVCLLDNAGKQSDFSAGYPELSGKIVGMEADRKGNGKFFATLDGVYYYSSTNKGLKKLLDEECYSIFLDLNDSLWLSTQEGLFICAFRDFVHGSFNDKSRMLDSCLGLSNVIIKNIAQGKFGSVWLISDLQIYQVISTDQKAIVYEKEIGLKNNTILSVLEDAEDNLWIGFSGGLQRLTNKKGLRNFFPATLNSYIYSILEDRKGRIWISSFNGLFYYDDDLNIYSNPNLAKNERCVAASINEGDLIIANSKSVYLLDGSNLKIVKEKKFKFPLEDIENIFISSRGEIFLLTGISGIVYYMKNLNSDPEVIQSNETNNISHMLEANGEIYAGNATGVLKFENGQFIQFKDLDCQVYTLAFDEGKIWVGSECGLGILSGGEYSKINFSTKKNRVVKSILPARNRNYLWLGTNSGVSYFNKSNTTEEFIIDSKDGLSGDEITVEGLFIDTKGLLWIGTYHGISNYNLRASSGRTYSPLCYIEKMALNGKEIDPSVSHIFKHNQNNIAFEIAALSFANEQSIEYEFYLRGLENEYSSYNKGKEYKALYPNLLPGTYEFVYRAKGKNNIWGYAQKYQFTINKAWYDTWIFRIFVILTILSAFWTFYRIRMHSIEMQKRKLEQLVKERTRELEQANAEIEAQRDLAEEQRDQIIQQKKEITDSIQYAQRIQRIILPSSSLLNLYLPEYFVLFKPRDIVSGDFFWITSKDDKIILTASDCTGHGVPGAFMSLLGITYLNEITSQNSVLTAGEILDQLRNYIIKALDQKGIPGENKDGMDMALCILDFKKMEIQFAGANNPLYILRNNELQEIKGDKMPVAIHERMQNFANHTIQIKKGDALYMCSDGFEDQFGGPLGKKFMSKALKQMIISLGDLAMMDQKIEIERKFDEWKGNLDQMDDVVMIGLRI